MKRLSIILLGLTLFFASCGADQATVTKATDELCEAYANYDEKNPSSTIKVLGKVSKIMSNESYQSITEAQLMDAMNEKCPKAAKHIEKLLAGGK